MQEKKAQPQHPTQNLQMMRAKPYEEDPNVNIVLRSKVTTGDDKGKQPEEDGWVCRALEKEIGFDLKRAKETFMEAKKIFTEASTLGSQNNVSRDQRTYKGRFVYTYHIPQDLHETSAR